MFTVIWRSAALDQLADAFVRADLAGQDVLERRVLGLNVRLATDPTEEGESRSGNVRVAFSAPVGILFNVDPGTRVVRVTHFWTY